MRRGVLPLVVLALAASVVLGAVYYKVSTEPKRVGVAPESFPEDSSTAFAYDFSVLSVDYGADQLVFEVKNKDKRRLDGLVFWLYTASGAREYKHFNEQVGGGAKKVFVYTSKSDLLSCPYKVELAPQVLVNGVLTTLVSSKQVFFPKCSPQDAVLTSQVADCVGAVCVNGTDKISLPNLFPFDATPTPTPFSPVDLPSGAITPTPSLPGQVPSGLCKIARAFWLDYNASLPKPSEMPPFLINVAKNNKVRLLAEVRDCVDGERVGFGACQVNADTGECTGVGGGVPSEIEFPSGGVVIGGVSSIEWGVDWPLDPKQPTVDPRIKFIVTVGEEKRESDNILNIGLGEWPSEVERHLACRNQMCTLVEGDGADECSPEGSECGVLAGQNYPKLNANIFDPLYDSNTCRTALSAYSGVTTDSVFSSGRGGGYDYGTLKGYGSHKTTRYKPGDTSPDPQFLYTAVKKLNPDFKLFSHTSIGKVEADAFDAGTTYPKRWFLDSLSPRWYAYSPLMELQEAVSGDPTQVVFKFPRRDVEKLIEWGIAGTGRDYWLDSTKFEWAYLSFFDNNQGGGRGTLEIMAVKDIELTSDYGLITVALKKDSGRTIFGSPQSYEKKYRAGILSNSDPGFGSLAFLMNRYCTRELEATTNCNQIRVDGLNWIEAAAEYDDLFIIPASYDGIYLNDGLEMDADGTILRAYGFRLAGTRQNDYHLDQDFNGKVDDFDAISDHLPELYQEFSKIIKTEIMPKHNRQDFMIIVNGELTRGPNPASPVNYPYINGRRFEDLNAEFEGTYKAATEQYQQVYSDKDFLSQPVYVDLSERARYAYDNGTEDYEEHRNILALTLVLGDGGYDHTYYHSAGIPFCSRKARDDWFDEMSVDENGVSSLHPTYSADVVCDEVGFCDKNRFQHVGWLGKALGEGYTLAGYKNAWRRDFEKGSAFFSMEPREVRVKLGAPLKKINGVDPDNSGKLYNDGSLVTEVVLPAVTKEHKGQGMILLKA